MTKPKKGTEQEAATVLAAIEKEFPHKDRTAKRSEIRVWDTVQKQMPRTPKEVMDALALDLKTHGMVNRIAILPDGRIIDGVTRYTLTADHPLYRDEIPVREYDVPEEVAEDMAWALNFDRRPISDEVRMQRVRATVKHHPEWTDRRIAERCGASPTTVGKIRKELEDAGQVKTPDVQKGRGGKSAKKETKGTRKSAAAKASAKKATKAARKSRPQAPKTANLLGATPTFKLLLGNRPQEGILEIVRSEKLEMSMLPKHMDPKHWDILETWHVFLAGVLALDPRHGNGKE